MERQEKDKRFELQLLDKRFDSSYSFFIRATAFEKDKRGRGKSLFKSLKF